MRDHRREEQLHKMRTVRRLSRHGHQISPILEDRVESVLDYEETKFQELLKAGYFENSTVLGYSNNFHTEAPGEMSYQGFNYTGAQYWEVKPHAGTTLFRLGSVRDLLSCRPVGWWSRPHFKMVSPMLGMTEGAILSSWNDFQLLMQWTMQSKDNPSMYEGEIRSQSALEMEILGLDGKPMIARDSRGRPILDENGREIRYTRPAGSGFMGGGHQFYIPSKHTTHLNLGPQNLKFFLLDRGTNDSMAEIPWIKINGIMRPDLNFVKDMHSSYYTKLKSYAEERNFRLWT